MARALTAIVLAGVLITPAITRADEPAGTGSAEKPAPAPSVDAHAIETFLSRGQKLFDEQEYAGAIQTLAPVTRDARATRAQRLRALELMALAHFIRGDQGAARATFERVLDIDPGYQLRDTSGSPKIRAFFDELKTQLIPGFDPNAGADLEHAVPTAGTAARLLELDVRATRGGERVFELIIATRRRGELTYKFAGALPRGDGKWRARVTPPPSSKPYVLEYYVEARDAGGAAIARIAAPDAPLEIALNAGGAEGKRPWYGRWYVIGGAAVVAAGITGLAVAASRGPGPGSLPPGSVTVSP
ncbi:MAG: hypothetical protein M3619_26655 [Myxococcota bacterium]|nr:hypothetical protein [Myxococcota bacterium]